MRRKHLGIWQLPDLMLAVCLEARATQKAATGDLAVRMLTDLEQTGRAADEPSPEWWREREQNARRALDIADSAFVMEQGRIVLEGLAAAMRDDPQVQALYLGVDEGGQRRSYRDVKNAKRRARWL